MHCYIYIQVLTSMVKYGKVWHIMKITVTIPDDIYSKLERDRGLVPRSSFIQQLIKGWRGSVAELGELSTGVSTAPSKSEDMGSSPVAPASEEECAEIVESATEEFKTYFKERKSGKQK